MNYTIHHQTFSYREICLKTYTLITQRSWTKIWAKGSEMRLMPEPFRAWLSQIVLRCVGADLDLIMNVEHFTQIDLDRSRFDYECNQCFGSKDWPCLEKDRGQGALGAPGHGSTSHMRRCLSDWRVTILCQTDPGWQSLGQELRPPSPAWQYPSPTNEASPQLHLSKNCIHLLLLT